MILRLLFSNDAFDNYIARTHAREHGKYGGSLVAATGSAPFIVAVIPDDVWLGDKSLRPLSPSFHSGHLKCAENQELVPRVVLCYITALALKCERG